METICSTACTAVHNDARATARWSTRLPRSISQNLIPQAHSLGDGVLSHHHQRHPSDKQQPHGQPNLSPARPIRSRATSGV